GAQVLVGAGAEADQDLIPPGPDAVVRRPASKPPTLVVDHDVPGWRRRGRPPLRFRGKREADQEGKEGAHRDDPLRRCLGTRMDCPRPGRTISSPRNTDTCRSESATVRCR